MTGRLRKDLVFHYYSSFIKKVKWRIDLVQRCGHISASDFTWCVWTGCLIWNLLTVSSIVPTRPSKLVFWMVQNHRVDFQWSVYIHCHIFSQHFGLHLWPFSLRWPNNWYEHRWGRNVYYNCLRGKCSNRSSIESLHLDTTHSYRGQRYSLVHLPYNLWFNTTWIFT